MMQCTNKADFGGWWLLVWTRVVGHPDTGGGAITHAMDNDGIIACGRKMPFSEGGAASDDDEPPMPSCKQCRKRVEHDRAARASKIVGAMQHEKRQPTKNSGYPNELGMEITSIGQHRYQACEGYGISLVSLVKDMKPRKNM